MSEEITSPIPVSGPSITQKEIDYVLDAVQHAWYDKANMYNTKFEQAFAKYVGRTYGACLPSCTSAIHLALLALGVGEGDEVIVPDVTWIATSAPITYVGATPVFVDINQDSWCISPESMERHITSKTKAIIIVDLYGNIPDMDEIIRIAKKHKVPIIEDSAQAMGSEYKGKKAGSFGNVSVFSFHGSKIMTSGEGGMLVTDDQALYERCLKLRDHGRALGPKLFWNDEVGYKYKMSSMQAALGLGQLERIDELVAARRTLFSSYKEKLKKVEGIFLNKEPHNVLSNYWMITVCWDDRYDISKEEFIRQLELLNVSSRPFFYPLSMEPAYADIVFEKGYEKKNPVSYAVSQRGINLPSGMNMTEELADYVCLQVKKVLSDYQKKDGGKDDE